MTLYHYTDQNGFMGIFLSQELWASKIQYLNDEKEYNLALNLAESYLKKLIEKTKDRALKDRLAYYLDITPYIKDTNVCVCSLTENGDLLSQWRGYSRTLGGYSIGFNTFALKPFLRLQGFELVQCVYDPKEQEKQVSEIINNMVSEFSHEAEPDYKMDPYYESGHVFLERLAKIAPTLKDASFTEEAEWRILATVNFKKLEFRAGRSMLTPYCRISLDCTENNDFNRLISEVIIGHTPHLDLAISATEAFILKHFPPMDNDDYQCPIVVKKSSIPFRNW
jgi:hypothetical protein